MQIAKCSPVNLNYKRNTASLPEKNQITFGGIKTIVPDKVSLVQNSLVAAIKAIGHRRGFCDAEANSHLAQIGQVLDAMSSKMTADCERQNILNYSDQVKALAQENNGVSLSYESASATNIQNSLAIAKDMIYETKNIYLRDSNLIFVQVATLLYDMAGKIKNKQTAQTILGISDGLKRVVIRRSPLYT